MKRVLLKIPAMVGMLWSLLTLYLVLGALIYLLFPALLDDGTSVYDPSFGAWQCELGALLCSAFGTVFFAVDAVICGVWAAKGQDRRFNLALCVALAFGVALGAFTLFTVQRTYKNVIWFCCYFLLLAWEAVSVVRLIRACRRERREASE